MVLSEEKKLKKPSKPGGVTVVNQTRENCDLDSFINYV
jgi:hypothetical protein